MKPFGKKILTTKKGASIVNNLLDRIFDEYILNIIMTLAVAPPLADTPEASEKYVPFKICEIVTTTIFTLVTKWNIPTIDTNQKSIQYNRDQYPINFFKMSKSLNSIVNILLTKCQKELLITPSANHNVDKSYLINSDKANTLKLKIAQAEEQINAFNALSEKSIFETPCIRIRNHHTAIFDKKTVSFPLAKNYPANFPVEEKINTEEELTQYLADQSQIEATLNEQLLEVRARKQYAKLKLEEIRKNKNAEKSIQESETLIPLENNHGFNQQPTIILPRPNLTNLIFNRQYTYEELGIAALMIDMDQTNPVSTTQNIPVQNQSSETTAGYSDNQTSSTPFWNNKRSADDITALNSNVKRTCLLRNNLA